MDVVVIVALALAVVMLGCCLVAGRELYRTVRRLTAATATTRTSLVALTDELQTELAVSATEIQALQERAAVFSADRHDRKRRGRR